VGADEDGGRREGEFGRLVERGGKEGGRRGASGKRQYA